MTYSEIKAIFHAASSHQVRSGGKIIGDGCMETSLIAHGLSRKTLRKLVASSVLKKFHVRDKKTGQVQNSYVLLNSAEDAQWLKSQACSNA